MNTNAAGLNNKAITQDWRIRLALPLFWAIDFLLSKPRIARYLFDRFRSKDNLRTVLKVGTAVEASRQIWVACASLPVEL